MKKKAPGFVCIVRVGSEARPANDGDIQAVADELQKAQEEDRVAVLPAPVDVIKFNPGIETVMVCVGNAERPAHGLDVDGVRGLIDEAMKRANAGEDVCLVTHHAVDLKRGLHGCSFVYGKVAYGEDE